jgi:hypothetical protein
VRLGSELAAVVFRFSAHQQEQYARTAENLNVEM